MLRKNKKPDRLLWLPGLKYRILLFKHIHEADRLFIWAHIIMHMLHMRIVNIIRLSVVRVMKTCPFVDLWKVYLAGRTLSIA